MYIHVIYYILYIILLGVWEYIEATRDMVRDLEERVQLAKFNVEEINKIMSKWYIQPLYQRKEDKTAR